MGENGWKVDPKTGEIEFILSQLNWNLSLNDDSDDFNPLDRFSGRVKRAIPIVENSFIKAAFKNEISRTLHKCLELSKVRNVVAHNPVYMETYIDSPLAIKHREVIGSLSGPRLNYQELCEAAELAVQLAKKLSDITSDQRVWRRERA